jgi:hypothetical protein
MSSKLPGISTVNNMLGLAFPEQALRKSVSLAVETELIKKYPRAVVIPHHGKYLVYLQVNPIVFFFFNLFKRKKLEAQILSEIQDLDSQAQCVFIFNQISSEALHLLIS